MTGRTTLAAAGVLAGVAAVVAGQRLGRTAGTSVAERRRRLPGDDLVPDPSVVTDHAVSIAAEPGQVWPWLTQMGWHRGGWYTPRWVDRVLFPANWPSADVVDPELVRVLSAGDTVPDGPPGTAHFDVVVADAPQVLVLHSTTHLPSSWRRRTGARIDWTWAFVLSPVPHGCRLHLRVRGRTSPWWLTVAYVVALVPADFVMGVGMLRGLRRRVERGRGSVAVEQQPVQPADEAH